MKCLVTGAAGFIGSHLCERLVSLGHDVLGLDAFVPYYEPEQKRGNLQRVQQLNGFELVDVDLRKHALEPLLDDVEVIFHLAAMPGLVQSWVDFDGYWSCNVLGTQRLLEAIRGSSRSLKRFIYASTSSVYGRFASGDESLPTRPISPYGVTKLAAEHLCRAHSETHGLPVVALRYFSVYGPRQRPDMAYNRFVRALLLNEPLVVYGDGRQVRGNTFFEDCVSATVAAVDAIPGEVYNVGGGETADVWDIIRRLERLSGRKATIRQEAERPGDQRYTFADTSKLRRHLGWAPRVTLDEGLMQQIEWQTQQLQRQPLFQEAA
jgi:nucleoside-diphosphate-sugar epimerase